MWNSGHDPLKRSSSALKSPRKASLMCNGWKVFPERWGKRNTEEERGCLKELPWQSGLISLCTYTRTLHLSDSPSSSSHSLYPSPALAFLSFCSLCFPWQWTLESALHVCYVETARKTEREWGREQTPFRVLSMYVCETKAFPTFMCFGQAKTLISNCFVPKTVVLDQNVSCQSRSSLIMILKHPDLKGGLAEVGHFPQGCLIPCTILHHPQYQMYWIWAMHQTCALVTVKGAILSLKKINQSINVNYKNHENKTSNNKTKH